MMKRLSLVCLIVALCGLAVAEGDRVVTRVNITSQPDGASVIVDGIDRGTTPLMLFDLAPGRHHVKYRKAGYVERDRFFTTDEVPLGQTIEKNEVLVEEKGLLLLKTTPEDCNIQIDGVSVGRTPRLITNLAAKDSYTVKFTKAGYQDHVITVKFNGRSPLVREETLVLDSGVINVTSEPAGAEVTVNGLVRGRTPVLVRGIPKGRAVVKFVLDGYREEVRELAMRAGDQQELPIVLTALPGTLHLTSVPAGARFYVNDESRGVSPLSITSLKPGDYRVRCEKEGFGTMTRTITIENGGSAREEFRLANVMGRLEIRTEPAGTSVIFDGHLLGMTKRGADDAGPSAVFPIENVLEGEHTLMLRHEGYEEIVRHPRVQKEKTATGFFRLKRIFVPDVEIETDRGTYRGILVQNTPEAVVVEVMLGITRSFSRPEIRKITFLNGKAK